MSTSPFLLPYELDAVDELFIKLSKPRIDVSENEDSWESEALDAFYAEHPWASRVTVRTNLVASNDEGFAAGYFILTPQQVPAAATSIKKIGVIAVPIIIKNFKLQPMDVFHYKENFYPLTEGRAMRILRLPDIFMESDRSVRELEDASQERTWRNTSWGNDQGFGYSGGRSANTNGFKFSAAVVRQTLLKEALVSAVKALDGPRMTRDLRNLLKESAATTHPLLLERASNDPALRLKLAGVPAKLEEKAEVNPITKLAKLEGVEIEKRSDAFYARGYWASDPETGRASRGEWTKTSLAHITKAFSSSAAEVVLNKGWTFVKESGFRASHTMSRDVIRAQELEAFDELEKISMSLGHVVAKSQFGSISKESAQLSKVHLFVAKGDKKSLMTSEKSFRGNLIYSFDADNYWPVGVVAEGGAAHVGLDYYDISREFFVFPTEDKDVFTPTDVLNYCQEVPSSDTGETAGEYLLCRDDDLWYGLYLLDSTRSTSEGKTYRKGLTHRGNTGKPDEISFSETFNSITIESKPGKDAPRVIHVPKMRSTIFPLVLSSDKLRSILSLGEGSEKMSSVRPETLADMHRVTISWDGRRDGYAIGHPTLAKISAPNSRGVYPLRDAALGLALCGFNDAEIGALLKTASKRGEVTLSATAPPYYDEGHIVSEEMSKTSSMISTKLSRFAREFTGHNEMLRGASHLALKLHHATGISKLSSLSLNASVDAMLSLGFLTQANVMKFVDMRPAFEECLSSLCALLVAVRLGLNEVPEEDVEQAITSLDPIVSALRGIQVAVTLAG